MAAVRRKLTEKLVVTSTVLCIVPEQAMERYGSEKKLPKPTICFAPTEVEAELPRRLHCTEQEMLEDVSGRVLDILGPGLVTHFYEYT